MIIDGREAPVPSDARVSLLDFVREQLELHGTKKGCNQGWRPTRSEDATRVGASSPTRAAERATQRSWNAPVATR
jgi:hypothetical protein